MINKIRGYLLEEEFTVNIFKNKINVVNYTNIDHFDFNKVVIRYKEGILKIIGNDLVVSKLLNDEILIIGEIHKIELR